MPADVCLWICAADRRIGGKARPPLTRRCEPPGPSLTRFSRGGYPAESNAGEKIGRDDRIRTCDPLTPSQVRYQAALHPDAILLLSDPRLLRFARWGRLLPCRSRGCLSCRATLDGLASRCGRAALRHAAFRRLAPPCMTVSRSPGFPTAATGAREARRGTTAIRDRTSAPSASRTSAASDFEAAEVTGADASSRRRAPETVNPSPKTSCLMRWTCSTSLCRYSRGVSGDFWMPMPGNSFSQERSTCGCT